MPSYRKIKIESPRQGIMKSSKNIEEDHPKQKHIKMDLVGTHKTISIDGDNDSISLDNNENATQKYDQYTIKTIVEHKKGCLKNGDHSGLSLKKIAINDQAEIGSCKSFKSSKSIKFNKKTNVYVYRKEGEKKEDKKTRAESLKKAMKQNPVMVETSQGDQCCVIY